MKNFMSNVKSRYLVGLIVLIIFGLFNMFVFVFSDMNRAQANFWCGYIFTSLAFLLMFAVVVLTTIPKRQIFNVVGPFYMATMEYLGITLVFNIFLLAFPDGTGWDAKLGVIPNVVLLAIYIIYMIVLFIGARHISQDAQRTYAAVTEIRSLANIVFAFEPDVASAAAREEVHRLGEDIRYSDPMGNQATASLDEDLRRAISVLGELIAAEESEEDITKAAKRARAILRNRNAVLKSSKVG